MTVHEFALTMLTAATCGTATLAQSRPEFVDSVAVVAEAQTTAPAPAQAARRTRPRANGSRVRGAASTVERRTSRLRPHRHRRREKAA